jgi:hypothetical protein
MCVFVVPTNKLLGADFVAMPRNASIWTESHDNGAQSKDLTRSLCGCGFKA